MKKPVNLNVYYGWFIVATTFFVTMVTMGTRNAIGVFVLPMSEEFGWSRSIISFAAAVGILVSGLSQPILGHIYDNVGGRRLILLGILVIGTTVVLMSLTFHFLYFILVFGVVMAVAMSAGSITTGAVLVSKWFQRRRATAISITGAGSTVGSFLLVPLATYLIILIEWRLTWVVLGMIVLILVLPLAFFLLRNEPADIGLLPDGARIPSIKTFKSTHPREQLGPLAVEEWRKAFNSVPIWQLSGTYFVCGFTTLMMAFHFVPYAIEGGLSPYIAATAFGFLSIMNTIGVLVVGPFADKLGNKNLLSMMYALRGLGYASILLLPGQWGLWVFAIIGGASWVATVPLTTALTADIYGLKKTGTLNGLIFMSHQIGGSIGIQFGGMLRDITGSYSIPFGVASLLLLIASIASFMIDERRYSVKYQSLGVASISVGD
ncbi:MFS transporter [Dehalococcoidia bacterium]|nr:MFS transporter [Dehalococcoidia bacterium]